MTNTMKHLSLLGRMETDGLMLSLTGLFSENELDGACEKVERLELQVRLKKNRSSQIQRKLVECGEFADLYHALCTCEIEDDRIEPMLKSADDCHESLTQYPTVPLCEHDKILTFHKCCVNLLRGNFSSLDIINILDLLIMRIYCCTNKIKKYFLSKISFAF